MARSYSVRLVSLTLGCRQKWVDNLLSHHAVIGIEQSRQGIERKVRDEGVVAIEITRLLFEDLNVPLAKAVVIANEAVRARGDSSHSVVTRRALTLTFPLASIETRLRQQMVEAIESLGRVARGRPRLRATEKKQKAEHF